MEDFNKVLKIMDKKGISQKDLADYLGVTEQRVSDWKSGRIKSWLKYIDKIAYCLGVTVGDCLGVKATEKPADQLSGLKHKLYEVMDDFTEEELQRMAEYADLLESARRNKAKQ